MSNLDLPTDVFKSLYRNNRELNKEILTQIKDENVKCEYDNLYEFYTKNTSLKIIKEYENYSKFEYKNQNKDLRFKVLKIQKIKSTFKDIIEKVLVKTNSYSKNKLKDLIIKNRYKDTKDKLHFEIKEKKVYSKSCVNFDTNNDEKIISYLVNVYKYVEKKIDSRKYFKEFFDNLREEVKQYTTYNIKIFDRLKDKLIYNKQDYKVYVHTF